MRSPTYGVINVMPRTRAPTPSALSVGPVCWYEHTDFIDTIAVGSSATCAVVEDSEAATWLVQFLPGPAPHVESRRLPIPKEIVYSQGLFQLALHDRLGAVYLAHALGSETRFTVFEFA
ncbi:hypothetical protein FB45DRAFT_1038216 [Roridomyces roridus]|uniref:Uncharacterized protein n=1 Tax=Roridomyces roridus TaxID=1738132 RepID=A0AAD7B512_9AGAR|nr:hypothetical protein FB45DRAFT_1038216 [Roridomyces roridus]